MPSPRNKTIRLSDEQRRELRQGLAPAPERQLEVNHCIDRLFCGNMAKILPCLPHGFVDLLILDPPYNLDKNFAGLQFSLGSEREYYEYLESWFPQLMPLLKSTASVYLCGDWHSAGSMSEIMTKYLHLRNRITWQREKGRGALANWKNACEDIWFGTVSQKYTFNIEAVKMRRKVIAPYRNENGRPKDWEENAGGRYRMTCPSNFWDDISVPYWSMPENTPHPTQKPEKLLAKLILASSNPGDMVFDPFMGSGTTAVTAKKLNRKYCGIELNEEYCLLALERLKRAETDSRIQGYADGCFWERNTADEQKLSGK